MNYRSVHMRDQKANQMAMLAQKNRQALSMLLEEISLIALLWGIFFVASLS